MTITIETRDILACICCGSKDQDFVCSGLDYEYSTCNNSFNFFKCGNCGHLYLGNQPVKSSLSVIYPGSYLPTHFDKALSLPVRLARKIVQNLKVRSYRPYLSKNSKILEIGAGNGALVEAFLNRGDSTWKLFAQDFNCSALRRLSDRGVIIQECEFDDYITLEKFDLIIMNQFIEHVGNPLAVIKKCTNMLSDKGAIIVETPNINSLDFAIFSSGTWGGLHIPRHFNLFSPESFEQMISKSELSIKKVSYMASPSFWIQSLHHSLKRSFPKLPRNFLSINNILLISLFTAIDLILAKLKVTSNIRFVLRLREEKWT